MIVLLRSTEAQDEVGQVITVDQPGNRIAAERLELRFSDAMRAVGRDHTATARYRIRWRTDIEHGQHVRIDGRAFVITGIDAPDRRQSLILTCEALK